MSSPAERLLAAADLLDKRAGEADSEVPAPWASNNEGYSNGVAWIDSASDRHAFSTHGCPASARYIATMHPEVGKALAVVLRTEGERISGTAALAVAFDGSPLHPARPDLLALADLLLAGES